jgi:hypothetical protein
MRHLKEVQQHISKEVQDRAEKKKSKEDDGRKRQKHKRGDKRGKGGKKPANAAPPSVPPRPATDVKQPDVDSQTPADSPAHGGEVTAASSAAAASTTPLSHADGKQSVVDSSSSAASSAPDDEPHAVSLADAASTNSDGNSESGSTRAQKLFQVTAEEPVDHSPVSAVSQKPAGAQPPPEQEVIVINTDTELDDFFIKHKPAI